MSWTTAAWAALRSKVSKGVGAGTVAAVAGAVLLGALFVWALRDRPVEVEVAAVQPGLYEDAVEDDGRTRVRERIAVTLPWAGELERPVWKEGQWAEVGDVLIRVRPAAPVMRDARTQAELRARRASAEAAWQRSARQTEAALVAWQRSLLTAARTVALAEDGFVSNVQVESAALDLRRDERSWQAAREAEGVALHDLEQARAAVGEFGRSDAAHVVKADRRAQILRVLQPHAATLAAGTAVLEMGDTRNPEVVVPLLTQEAATVQPGATVRLGDPRSDRQWTGRVRVVEPAASTKISALGLEEQRVNVVIDPISPMPAGDGHSVRVQVLRRREAQVLLVPASALFPHPQDPVRQAVFVVQDGRARLQAVSTHERGRAGAGGRAWLLDGVDAGREVVVFPPASLVEGGRVRVVKRISTP